MNLLKYIFKKMTIKNKNRENYSVINKIHFKGHGGFLYIEICNVYNLKFNTTVIVKPSCS